MQKSVKEKTIVIIELTLCFLFFFCFFSVVHPIVLSDTDDWTYANYTRDAVPKLGDWNPTRDDSCLFGTSIL